MLFGVCTRHEILQHSWKTPQAAAAPGTQTIPFPPKTLSPDECDLSRCHILPLHEGFALAASAQVHSEHVSFVIFSSKSVQSLSQSAELFYSQAIKPCRLYSSGITLVPIIWQISGGNLIKRTNTRALIYSGRQSGVDEGLQDPDVEFHLQHHLEQRESRRNWKQGFSMLGALGDFSKAREKRGTIHPCLSLEK